MGITVFMKSKVNAWEGLIKIDRLKTVKLGITEVTT